MKKYADILSWLPRRKPGPNAVQKNYLDAAGANADRYMGRLSAPIGGNRWLRDQMIKRDMGDARLVGRIADSLAAYGDWMASKIKPVQKAFYDNVGRLPGALGQFGRRVSQTTDKVL